MKPVVIAGAVAAGMSAASALKRKMPDLQVIVYLLSTTVDLTGLYILRAKGYPK